MKVLSALHDDLLLLVETYSPENFNAPPPFPEPYIATADSRHLMVTRWSSVQYAGVGQIGGLCNRRSLTSAWTDGVCVPSLYGKLNLYDCG